MVAPIGSPVPQSTEQSDLSKEGLGRASTVQVVVDFIKENKGIIFFAVSIMAIPVFAMPSLATYSIAELIDCAIKGALCYFMINLMIRVTAIALTGKKYSLQNLSIQNLNYLAFLFGTFHVANLWFCPYSAIEYTMGNLGALGGFIVKLEELLYGEKGLYETT